ncbi:hypothetical protein D9M71_837930 [compost metagenome]
MNWRGRPARVGAVGSWRCSSSTRVLSSSTCSAWARLARLTARASRLSMETSPCLSVRRADQKNNAKHCAGVTLSVSILL